MKNLLLFTKIALLVMLVMAGFGVSGQSISLDRTLLNLNPGRYSRAMTLGSSNVICLLSTKKYQDWDTTNYIRNRYSLHKLNRYGDTIQTCYLGLDTGFALSKLGDDKLIGTLVSLSFPNSLNGYEYSLCVLDTNFNILKSTLISPRFPGSSPLLGTPPWMYYSQSDKMVYFSGRVQNPVTQRLGIKVNKFDTSGNLKWSKLFEDNFNWITSYGAIDNAGNLVYMQYSIVNGIPAIYRKVIDSSGTQVKFENLVNRIQPNWSQINSNATSLSLSHLIMANGNYLFLNDVDGSKVLYVYDSSFTNRVWFSNISSFNPGYIQTLADGGFIMMSDNFPHEIRKYDSLGVQQWSTTFRTANRMRIMTAGVDFSRYGDLYMTGSSIDSLGNENPWFGIIQGVGFPHVPVIGQNVPLKVKPTLPREYTATPQPNPTANRFTIPGVGREGVLSLVNASGQVVKQESFVPGSEIDISALPKGLYLFRLVSEGSVTQGKVVRE